MAVTLDQIRRYLANKKLAEQIILNKAAQRGEIIYGARAINAQLPYYLEKHTDDYDVYTKYPSKAAKDTAKELNKQYGNKLFYVKKAINPGTYKVKNKYNKETIVDYTRQSKEIPTVNRMGVRYAAIEYLKKNVKRQIRVKENAFRRPKDKESLNRIMALEEQWQGVVAW